MKSFTPFFNETTQTTEGFVSRNIQVVRHSRLGLAHSCFHEKNFLYRIRTGKYFNILLLSENNSVERKTLRQTTRQGQMADDNAIFACGKKASKFIINSLLHTSLQQTGLSFTLTIF